MNSNMVKPKQCNHLHLVYHFTVPLARCLHIILVLRLSGTNLIISGFFNNCSNIFVFQDFIVICNIFTINHFIYSKTKEVEKAVLIRKKIEIIFF